MVWYTSVEGGGDLQVNWEYTAMETGLNDALCWLWMFGLQKCTGRKME